MSTAVPLGRRSRLILTVAAVLGVVAFCWPLFVDPENSPEYLGTVIADPGSESFIRNLQFP